MTGKEYTYLDTSAQAGMTYYYELQEVERNGRSTDSDRSKSKQRASVHCSTLVLGGLAVLVLVIWLRGGRLLQKARSGNG